MSQARSWGPFGVALILIGMAGVALGTLQQHRRLGEPGLKMVAARVLADDGRVLGTNSVALPETVLDYHSEVRPITKVEADFLPSDTTFARRYYEAEDRFGIAVNVVLMGQDRTSIHRPQLCLTGQGWTIERSEVRTVELQDGAGGKLPVMRLTASRRIQGPDGRPVLAKAIYVYWFVADGQVTAQHGERMWWMARDLLGKGVLQRWAYVSCLGLAWPGTEEQAYRRMEKFIATAVPTFQHPVNRAP